MTKGLDDFRKSTETATVIEHRLNNGEIARFPSTYSTKTVERIIGEMNARRAVIPVMQDGHQIGWLPRDFNPDPRYIKSRSVLYDPRPGDFTRVDETWVVGRTLGGGDLEAVDGFVRYYGER